MTLQITLLLNLLILTVAAAQDLVVPVQSEGPPAAGKRVAVTPPEYTATTVHHSLYLPSDWSPESVATGKTWPVIVEYAGNHFPAAGSTGKVENTALGYGISAGRFIWVTLPFVDSKNKTNARTWWGDIDATINYATTNVPHLCRQFGGDPKTVFLCGFSRGAIATNFIGLHNDKIAALWCAFITHDHYDGILEWRGTTWGSPLGTYRDSATRRLARLKGRPALVCQLTSTTPIVEYLRPRLPLGSFTFLDIDIGSILGTFPNPTAPHPHTDRWLLKPSTSRQQLWDWVDRIVAGKPPHTDA